MPLFGGFLFFFVQGTGNSDTEMQQLLLEPQIQNSRFKIIARAAACGGCARSGPAGRELRASAAGGCGPPMPAASNLEASPQPSRGVRDVEDAALRPGTAAGCCAPKDAIKNSIFKITNSGCSLRSARKFGYELRASATPRLRPADASGIENPPESPQRRSLPKEKDRRCNTRSVS